MGKGWFRKNVEATNTVERKTGPGYIQFGGDCAREYGCRQIPLLCSGLAGYNRMLRVDEGLGEIVVAVERRRGRGVREKLGR